MADKDQIVQVFNKQFKEFIQDVERVFPNNTDLSDARKIVSKLLLVMPEFIIKSFYTDIYKTYGDQLLAGNLDYFLDHDFKKDLATMGIDASSTTSILASIDKLRGPVKNMNAQDKSTVIKYMQNLCKLSVAFQEL